MQKHDGREDPKIFWLLNASSCKAVFLRSVHQIMNYPRGYMQLYGTYLAVNGLAYHNCGVFG